MLMLLPVARACECGDRSVVCGMWVQDEVDIVFALPQVRHPTPTVALLVVPHAGGRLLTLSPPASCCLLW